MDIVMDIVILDAKTLGDDIEFSQIEKLGNLRVYETTSDSELEERIRDAQIIILNKVRLNASNLTAAKKLKLICVTATGYDNIDINYCWHNSIAVCNIKDYSTASVAQLTVSMALSLVTHLEAYSEYVRSGKYTESGVHNYLRPRFHEIKGMTWGIIGYGNIGGAVARIAAALGCRVIINPHRQHEGYGFVSVDELLREADIISLHVPLTPETKGMISKKRTAIMKDGVIFINVSRGGVVDEEAIRDAVISGKIGGLGIDVYSKEPLDKSSPFYELRGRENVIFTPHMAWGAYEARVRCINEIAKNIETFIMGGKRNRVDLK